MCTLALYYKVYPESPILLLSNRDEMVDRPWLPPAHISRVPGIYGPRDKTGGGTWLGVGQSGLVVALTNHYGTLATGASLCSRGYVVMEALRHETAREALRLAKSLAPACKHFTLLMADPNEAFVLDHPGDKGSQSYSLMPGFHVVTNKRFRDEEDVKAAYVKGLMEEQAKRGEPSVSEIKSFVGDHAVAPGQQSPLCIHPKPDFRFGTVSSAAVGIDRKGEVSRFLFSSGPACANDFEDYTEEAGKF